MFMTSILLIILKMRCGRQIMSLQYISYSFLQQIACMYIMQVMRSPFLRIRACVSFYPSLSETYAIDRAFVLKLYFRVISMPLHLTGVFTKSLSTQTSTSTQATHCGKIHTH